MDWPESGPLMSNFSVFRLPLLYVTLRDQLVSPLLQGAIWGLAGLAFGHVRAYLALQRAAPSPTNKGRRSPLWSLLGAQSPYRRNNLGNDTVQ